MKNIFKFMLKRKAPLTQLSREEYLQDLYRLREQICDLRRDKGLTMEELEGEAHLDLRKLLQTERGNRLSGMQIQFLIRYAALFGRRVEFRFMRR